MTRKNKKAKEAEEEIKRKIQKDKEEKIEDKKNTKQTKIGAAKEKWGKKRRKNKSVLKEEKEKKSMLIYKYRIGVIQILQIHQHISHHPIIPSSTGAMPEHSGSGGARAGEGEENQEVRSVPLGPREAG